MNKVSLNGVITYSFNSRSDLIELASQKKKSLIAINAEKILNATEQSRSLINKNIGYTDGVGAVWALKRKGFKETIKIPGCELWLDIITKFHESRSFYLVGAKEEVIVATIEKLQREYPGINILGYRNGYVQSIDEQEKLIETITKLKPDIVFVAMGSPKQELIMQEMQEHHSAIYQGLGGSFDVYVGNVERAPKSWVKNNLEWAYRLIKQPRRIKRQIHLVRFAFNVIIGRY
ncbi:WecB/TagA/CpsF family glycosyltransferase [Draconibacterium sediminis]|uniref:WecB/TagA/CpsF family glycosyltransferase n=1 Tax=Draconibacterium sediminis TaxID=1544798 RepID=UPI0026F1288F|nr:WecB/TagA/CpsF family glycosyltransferase [Draconibacterium sediminis]